MALTWILSEIATKVRAITGLLTTEDIEDVDLYAKINDYYRNNFPLVAYVSEFDDWFEQVTADEDGGEYAFDQAYLRLDTPATIMDSDDILSDVKLYQDKDRFFYLFPEEADPTESTPYAALIYGQTLYLRPEPDGIYTFRAACIKKPTALIAATAPPDLIWGPAIAYGTAIEMMIEDLDDEAMGKLTGVFQYHLNKIDRKKIMQKKTNQRTTPRF